MIISPEKKRFDAYLRKRIIFMPMGAILGRAEITREEVEPQLIDLRPGSIPKGKDLTILSSYTGLFPLTNRKL